MNVGIYIRLSDEDKNKIDIKESESIKNQRDIIKNYIKQNGLDLVNEYVDDGYSGTNFDRPGFKKMIKDIESGLINCVIVKDLSRLGRDYIQVGYYLEIYFPTNSVRFIAILDNYDTFKLENTDIAPFKSVVNDIYSKDLSKKCRSSLYSKMTRGEFIGARPPYGYKKDTNNKNKLIIDSYASLIVKRIFSEYINGYGVTVIAKRLNSDNIDVPSVYNSSNPAIISKHNLWKASTVSIILKNEMYIGNMIQHKYENISYKIHKKRKIDKSNVIIVENTHEPIIDKKTFDFVQTKLSSNTRDSNKKHDYLLSGLLRCKDCGHAICIRVSGNYAYTFCNYNHAYHYTVCSSHCNNYYKLEKSVLECLKNAISNQIINYDKINQEMNMVDSNNDKMVNDLKNKLERINCKLKTLYDDRLENIISIEEYKKYKNNCLEEKKNITDSIDSLINKKKNNLSYDELVNSLLKLEKPDKLIIQTLINKIEISEKKEITIYFNFCN
ncbi:MAG: recombinase family protein [Ignavibacteriales bacterium]